VRDTVYIAGDWPELVGRYYGQYRSKAMINLKNRNSTYRANYWLFCFAVCICLIGVAGCGSDSDRLEVTGQVNLDGAPLDSGSIQLTSAGGERLIASGAAIENGEFTIPQEKGLPPGTYLVEVSAPDSKAPMVAYKAGPGEPALPATAPERVPAEYNKDRKVEVSADGDNHFVFDIVTRKAK
jgi:hypothetical protein